MQNHVGTECAIANAVIVTPMDVFHGSVLIRNGVIADMSRGHTQVPTAVDFGGDFLIPGIVDIHTDNLEKHYRPRPSVTWDAVGAAVAHDAQMAASGVTTVFDSLSLYGEGAALLRGEDVRPMIAGLDEADANGLLRIDHKLHMRCEISTPAIINTLAPYLDHFRLGLMSTMDHTPGQRQLRNTSYEQLEEMMKASGRSDEEISRIREEMAKRMQADCRDANRADIAEAAARHQIPLASHDDETADHVAMAVDEGATIAEFPVTLDAARYAQESGLHVIMGAPNLLRGGSHSGNVAVAEVVEADALNALASDYLPLSLIRAAMLLTGAPFHWPLPKAIAAITDAPAQATGLMDRGAIAVGKRADLVRVRAAENGWPHVRAVWVCGERVV